jgi:dihydrodipicolinate synthase/N-acetylneuraminate lyase
MKYDISISGAFAPILTPFLKDGRGIDLAALGRHLAFLDNTGLSGVLMLGTNGEFGYLSKDERLQLVETVIAADTTLRLIVGGTVPESPENTLDLVAQLAEYRDSLTAILVAPPFYNKYTHGESVSEASVVEFYRQLAAIQEHLPLLLYNVPIPTERRMTAPVTPSVVNALKQAGIIVGVKDSTARLENIAAYLDAREDFQVLLGSDHVISEGLALGAIGSITACGNVFPTAVLKVYAAQPGPARETAQTELSLFRGVLESVPGKAIAIQKLLLKFLGVVENTSLVRDRDKNLTTSERGLVFQRLSAITAKLTINQELATVIQSRL